MPEDWLLVASRGGINRPSTVADARAMPA